MSASAGVRGSSSSSSSSNLKSSSSFRTTLALSVFRRLLSFDLLRVGESRPGGAPLGGWLGLAFFFGWGSRGLVSHFWEVVCDCFSFRVPPSLASPWLGAIVSSTGLARPLACCIPLARPLRHLVVVACRGRLLPLPFPLISWTSIFFIWVVRLPLQPGLAACCVMARRLSQVLAAFCLADD